ncbi:hypothetical protein V3851_26240 [Paenibacillus sp. M1]|uniref:O-antigen ligase domain-containing protein n=1 Tax=Paenibacillus haidiansis TaxID=1574488 RepID=A0ABU7VZU1_9BACL
MKEQTGLRLQKKFIPTAVLATALLLCLTGGMFFVDSLPVLLTAAVWLLASGAYAAGAVGRLSQSGNSQTQKLQGFSRVMDAALAAGPFAIAAMYAFHLAGRPASYQATLLAALCWLFYGCFGAALRKTSGAGIRDCSGFMERGWLLVTGTLAATALAAVYGWLPVPGAILRTEDRDIAAAGARLGGLLQYPNLFGAVMAAALLERLTALARLPRAAFSRAAGLRGYRTGALAPVFALCLLLSESRGALAAAAAGWAAGWLLLRGRQRLRYALHSGVAVAAGALLARQLAAAQLAPPALPGLLALVAGLAAALALSALAARAADWAGPGASRRRAVPLCAGLAALAACLGVAAVAGLSGRLANPATLLARGELYADALRLLGEAPWLGQGGDTWRTLYRGVQSAPYVGSEVHSGYLDIALDLGAAGLTVLAGWLALAAAGIYRSERRLLPPFIVLVLHSAVDFDMSYGLLWLLLLWLAAWGGQGGRTGRGEYAAEMPGLVPPPGRLPSFARDPFRRFTAGRSSHLARRITAGTAAALLLAGGVAGLCQAGSLRLSHRAAALAPADPAAARLLERAVALAPARAEARLALADVSAPAAAAETLSRGLAYEPSHPGLALALGTALARQGDPAALAPLRRSAELDRYSRGTQTAALRGIGLLTDRLSAAGRPEQAARAAAAGQAAYRRYARLALQAASGRNDRGFRMTAEAAALAKRLAAWRPGVFRSGS